MCDAALYHQNIMCCCYVQVRCDVPLKDLMCMQEAVSRGLSPVVRCCLSRNTCEHCAEDSPGSLGKQLIPAQEEG